MSLSGPFRRFSAAFARALGSPWGFIGHVVAVMIALALGPAFSWSTAYNFAFSNAISVDTLLVGLLILNASQRDSDVAHAKTDELIHALPAASDDLIGLQDRPDDELP